MSPDKPWMQNRELFIDQMRTGYKVQTNVAFRLLLEGLTVQVPPFSIINDVKKYKLYKDDKDITVGASKQVFLECKSRGKRISFTSPKDFPYKDMIVSTVSSFDSMTDKPFAMLSVCTHPDKGTGSVIWTKPEPEKWIKIKARDRVRNIYDTFYHCPKELFRPWEELIEELKEVTDWVPPIGEGILLDVKAS